MATVLSDGDRRSRNASSEPIFSIAYGPHNGWGPYGVSSGHGRSGDGRYTLTVET